MPLACHIEKLSTSAKRCEIFYGLVKNRDLWRNAKPGLALALAIAFPAAFVILFAAAVIAFAV